MPFAQLVIGPPGSGKSTYCDGMQQFMAAIERRCAVVNLDPANDHTSYPAALDVRDLVTLDEIMEAEDLGPNGGVLYALEELEHNFEWLEEGLQGLGDEYILFDCPGQVELFTHHNSLRNIFLRLQKLGYRLVVVHLVDSFILTQPSLYISSLLLSLRSMLQLDLPHLNVLTKIDNLASHDPLPLPLDFYTDASGLEYLLPHLDAEMAHHSLPSLPTPPPPPTTTAQPRRTSTAAPETPSSNKFTALNAAIVDLVSEYALVGFETLAVEDRDSMRALLAAIDRASGYAISTSSSSRNQSGASAAAADVWRLALKEPAQMSVKDVEERWITRRAEFDEAERRAWAREGRVERGEEGGGVDVRRVYATEAEATEALQREGGAVEDDELGPVRRVPAGLGSGSGSGSGGAAAAAAVTVVRR